MAQNTINDRTKKLIETVSEITDKQKDTGIFSLHKTAPEKVQAILAAKASLEKGIQNSQPIKRTIAEILAERTITDSRTGSQSVDLLGHDGKGFSSVTEFSADEIRSNLEALRARSATLQSALSDLQSTIESKIVNADPAKVEATIDIRGDINLRNAVRRVFGDKKKSLTFEDYKNALQLRSRFEKEEVEASADDEVKL